jgi:hypothetical protein
MKDNPRHLLPGPISDLAIYAQFFVGGSDVVEEPSTSGPDMNVPVTQTALPGNRAFKRELSARTRKLTRQAIKIQAAKQARQSKVTP